MHGRPRGARGHAKRGSGQVRQAELSSAYSALAAELTRTEIRSLGGYSLGRVIGEGTFGKVRLGVHRLTNTRVAIKQVPKSLPSNASDPSSPLSLLTREIHHHRRLRHPHVLSLYELLATESSIYLVTELCAGGELFDYLVEKGRLSLAETRRIFGQLVLGMAYLHGEGVVHRDLKLENVLLDERVNVKIADLGFGREFEKGKWMDTWVGTLGYCAPEVVSGKKYLGEEVDIWSLGVILYALLTGSLPFDDDDESIMKEMILKCEYDLPTWLDEDAADLVRSILVLDPLRRASLKQILSHPFFTRPSPAITRRPTLSRTHSHSSSLSSHHHFPSQQLHEEYPPAILEQEEGSSTHSPHYDRPTFVSEAGEQDQGVGPSQPRGSESAPFAPTTAAESDVSDSSYFSHGQGSQGKSGATSPITSAEEEEQGRGEETISAVKAGKRRAVEQGDAIDELGNLLRRNESQATLRRDAEEPDSTVRRRSTLPVSFEEPHALSSPGRLSAPPSPTPAPRTSFEAPGLQRNFSGGSSVRSIPIHGSPTPHARTPARTKRRSVGSIISERLISLDEEPSTGSPSSAFLPPVDYLALMTAPRPSPLASSGEKDLLDQLTTLGFDTGQMVHSVTTNACDSSAATWWMLKRKMDERERAKLEDDAAAAASAGGGGLSRASSLSVSSRRREPGTGEVEKSKELVPLSPQEEEPGEQLVQTSLPPPSSSAQTPERNPPDHATARDGLGYFVPQQPTASMSAPLLAYFPTVDPASPTRKKVPRSKSKDQLSSSPTLGTTNLFASSFTLGATSQRASPPESTNPFGTSASLDTSKDGSDAKNRRARASSVSMLQRATSAIGSSLSLIKSGEGKEEGGEEGSGMTHSTSIAAGLFRRKSSIPKEEDGTPRTPPLLPTASAPSSPHRSLDAPAPATPPRATPVLPAPSPLPSPAPSNAPSHDTFDTITSSTSSGRPRPSSSNTPPVGTKKGTKGGNLLANLKFWFGEGPRRRNKRSSPSRANDALSSTSLGRSQSLNSSYRGPSQAYVASPLRRPAIGSRRSSNNSIAPPSRRSSVSSAHRVNLHDHGHGSSFASPRPGLGLHHRRQSDSSRTSISDRGEHSRPPSVRSFSGTPGGSTDRAPPRRNRHSKAGSASSAGSYHPSVSPKDAVYRRPPTTTTVRRRHPSHSHGRHRRSTSGASSTHTHRSSTSSAGGGGSDDDGGFDDGGGADPIMEEDETADEDDKVAAPEEPVDEHVKAAARERALRTLSGDFSSSSPPSVSVSVSVSRPPLVHKASSSYASVHSESSSTSRHGAGHATFSAHKSTHLFGSPLQPRARSGSTGKRTAAPVVPRPPIRDVFAAKSKGKDGESDWVDEDELEGYGGGLGQASWRAQNLILNGGNSAGGGGGGGEGTLSYPGFLGAVSSPTLGGAKGDSPVANKTFGGGAGGGGGGASMFEGRYAGMGGGGGGGRRASAIRTVVIEEEEEED